MDHEWPELPPQFRDTVANFGAGRVVITLRDGRQIPNVYIAWGLWIVKVGDSQHVPFDPANIVDIQDQPP